MKRHIAHLSHYDSRAVILESFQNSIKDEATLPEGTIKIINNLKAELGEYKFDLKLQNFIDIGRLPMTILSYHNQFVQHSRYAFIHGFYYAALTSACSLGERILNHIILDLKEDFRHLPSYKDIYRKQSIADWTKAIDILVEWHIFQHVDVETEFRKLGILRNKSLHFNMETYEDLRKDALDAVKTITKILDLQFGVGPGRKWMIEGTIGQTFIKKLAENDPFIKRYFIPQCPLVGPKFSMSLDDRHQWIFFDFISYGDGTVNDEEFCSLFNNRDHNDLAPNALPLSEGVQAMQIIIK